MFCNYINEIYINHIKSNLTSDEIIYNHHIREHILDLWNDCTHIAERVVCPDPKDVYFIKNDTIQFKITKYAELIYITIYHEPLYSLSIMTGLSKQKVVLSFLDIIRSNIPYIIQKTIGNVDVDYLRSSYYEKSYAEDYNVSTNPEFVVKKYNH